MCLMETEWEYENRFFAKISELSMLWVKSELVVGPLRHTQGHDTVERVYGVFFRITGHLHT